MNAFKLFVLSSSVVISLVSLTACSTASQLKKANHVVKSTQTAVEIGDLKLNSAHMMVHLKVFQNIAEKHGGNRAVGTQGGHASAEYILNQAKTAGFTVQILPFENREKTVGQNILVEISGQSKETAIIVGAHYDSVKMGPGINDNASGVALSLELMHQLADQKIKSKHTIYLAFWDSEEVGIAGSQDYVKKLSSDQLKGIQAYINIDMVGTKNPDILIADADKSSLIEMENMLKESGMDEANYKPLTDGLRSIPSHAGDLALENHLKEFFKQKKLKIKEDVSTLTASDTAPFLSQVPVTSIILFNEQMKGDVLEFAPCYHQACDTIDQVDPQSLAMAGEAVIYLLKQINTP